MVPPTIHLRRWILLKRAEAFKPQIFKDGTFFNSCIRESLCEYVVGKKLMYPYLRSKVKEAKPARRF